MPLPRYRLYGGAGLYAAFAADYLAGRHRTDAEVPAFEDELARRFRSRHVRMTGMARTAIYDLVRYYARPGQRVLMSPYTIVDVVNMVLAAGALPVFVDVDPATGNLDPAALARAITPGAALVIVTHLHGVPADIEGVLHVARRAGLPVVEDAAQCVGAVIDGRTVGTFGDAGVFSFGSYKNINAHFGGVILTDDSALDRWLGEQLADRPLFAPAHLRRKAGASLWSTMALGPWFPWTAYPFVRLGEVAGVRPLQQLTRIELDTDLRPTVPDYYLGRFTDLQVAAARRQLPHLDDHADQRIAAAARYDAGLRGLAGLTLPPPPDGRRNIYGFYPVIVAPDRRADLVRHMHAAWRDVSEQHLHDVSSLPAFRHLGGPTPVASQVAAGVVLLPTWPGYGPHEQDANITALRAWARTV